MLDFRLYFVQDCKALRHALEGAVNVFDSREGENLGINEAPSFIRRTPEPIRKSINEQVGDEGLVFSVTAGSNVNKQKFSFEQEDFSEEVRNFRAQQVDEVLILMF